MFEPGLENGSALRRLIDLAVTVRGVPQDHVLRLGSAVLAAPEPAPGRDEAPPGRARGPLGLSGLNYDSSPLQLCLTATGSGVRSRLLGDPAVFLADPLARYRESAAALDRVLSLTRSSRLRPLCERTLALHLPEDETGYSAYTDGTMWLAAGLDTPGCALYMDARRGGEQAAWSRLVGWLSDILPPSSDPARALEGLRGRVDLLSLGLEGTSPENTRAKVYFRLRELRRIEDLGIERLKDPRFGAFLHMTARETPLRLSSVVLCVGFRVATGEPSDAKIDLCGCPNCLSYSPARWGEVARELAARFSLETLPLEECAAQSEVAFVGFGLDDDLAPRLNVYLKALPS